MRECHFLAQIAQFQFHKGSIKTIQEVKPAKLECCFNSIKVRLRHVFIQGAGD